jgi:sterol desaturase/sphingolipid hydroxylase (fatty acid hydroxylase superfamily)
MVTSSKFILIAAFVLIWLAETVFPFALDRRHRLRHAARNLILAGGNALMTVVLSAFLLVSVLDWADAANFGLLRAWSLPLWASIVLAIFLLDAWMYVWHRANHEWPLLWRFHRVHHSDTEMDVTTAMRFHPGEILLSGLLRAVLLPVLGISIQQVLLYDALMLPVIFFHHSNVNLPAWADRILRRVITTPALHRVHHSRLMSEANSNYGTIFSWWDRLARTFRLRGDGTRVELGVNGLDEYQTLLGLLRTPFVNVSSAKVVWSHDVHSHAGLPKPR